MTRTATDPKHVSHLKKHIYKNLCWTDERNGHILEKYVLFYQKINNMATIRHGGGSVMVRAWKPAIAGFSVGKLK